MGLIYMIGGVLTVIVAWLVVRCPLGFHEQPMIMERAKDAKGRDDRYAINWRCRRCMRLSKHKTTFQPLWALKAQIYRDRRVIRDREREDERRTA